MKHKSFILPSVGSNVKGIHILGKPYTGKISSVRPHTLNYDLIEFFIEFDEPTDLSSNFFLKDVRTSINVTASIEKSDMKEQRWVGPSGDYFTVIQN